MATAPHDEVPVPGPYWTHGDFHVGEWTARPRSRCVEGRDTTRELEPKAMHVLIRLAARPGQVVSKDELQRAVWPDTTISETVLPRVISLLRRALGDDPAHPQYIRTVPRVGYQLVAAVRPVAATARRRIRTGSLAATALVLLVLGIAWWARTGSAPPPATAPVRHVTSEPDRELQPALSPDGQRVVFVGRTAAGDWDLHLSRLDGDGTVPLAETPAEDELRPAWSPDGSRLAFLAHADGVLRVLSAETDPTGRPRLETARELARLDAPARGIDPDTAPKVSWSADSRTLALPMPSPELGRVAIHTLSLADGTRQRITDPPPGGGDVEPTFSPDGRFLTFVRHTNLVSSELLLLSLEDGSIRPLTSDGRSIRGHDWIRQGDEVVFASNRAGMFQLWTVSRRGGTPRLLPSPGWEPAHPATARDSDRLVYESWDRDADVWHATLSAPNGLAEEATPWFVSTRWDGFPSHSPSGDRIAFVSVRSGHPEIWIAERGAASPRRLTRFEGPFVGPPRWSPDGRTLVVATRPDGRAQLHRVDPGTGSVRAITDHPHNHLAPTFSGDGRFVYCSSDRDGDWQIWRLSLDDGSEVRLTGSGGHVAVESADGRRVFFARRGDRGLRSVARDGGPESPVLDMLAPGDVFNWTRVARDLVFVRRFPEGAELWALDTASGALRRLAGSLPLPDAYGASLSVSPDLREILLTRSDAPESDLLMVDLRRWSSDSGH